MATAIKWTPRAERDLMQIYAYIAENSPTYAAQYVNTLITSVNRQLGIFPLSGRLILELQDSPLDYLREVIYKSYRIVYNANAAPDEIRIIAVHHSRMDLLGQAESWVL